MLARFTTLERHSHNDKENETNLDGVGDNNLGLVGRGRTNRRDDSDKDKDSHQDIGDLVPDALQEGNLFLFGELVRSVLLQALLGFGRGQTDDLQVVGAAEFLVAVFLATGVPGVRRGAFLSGISHGGGV